MQIETLEQWWLAAERFITSEDAMEWVKLYVDPKDLRVALEQQDSALITTLLNKVWWRLPDDPAIRRLPLFFLMCDICSEAEVAHVGS